MAVLGLFAVPAGAQTIDQYLPEDVPGYSQTSSIPVLSRPRSDYDALGIRAGEFIIRSNLEEGYGFDSNPVATRPASGSSFISTAPSLQVNSDFSRNALGLSLGLLDERYLDKPNQSRTDFTSSIGGTYEIGRDSLSLAASYLSLHQEPADLDSASVVQPLGYSVVDLLSKYTAPVGRWQFEPNLEYLGYRFDNVIEPGDTASQTVRDRNLYAAGLTVRFNINSDRRAVIEARAVDTNYISPLGGSPRPDSFAYELLSGVEYAISGNLRLRALVGYEVRQFSNRAFNNQASPVTQASAVWTPTGLTTITAHVARSIEDSIGESTSGVTFTRAKLTLDHELRRNWLFNATAGVDVASFTSGSGQQELYSAGTSVTYLINRGLRAKLSYTFTERSGASSAQASLFGTAINAESNNYARNIALLSLRFSL